MAMYKNASTRAEDVTGGRTLAPGEYADIDPEDAHNKVLIDDGRLIPVPDDQPIPEAPAEEGPAEADTQAEPQADTSGEGKTDESTEKPDSKSKDKGAK